ncbi:MAG: alpha/beta hydrolase [Gammaproteobacteria bacterium]|nr:alpha/beta hydrolase [Gammaproteobacteria bacterium]
MRHLLPRGVRSGAAALVAGLALLGSPGAPRAGAPWQGLPRTPALPKPLSSGFAPVNGIRMFYATFGDGRPLLLLHGGLASSNYWGAVIPIFTAHDYKVIVADSRGHGRSTRTSQAYSYDLMAEDVVALLDYLKVDRADLVGWSDGGIIGLDIAMHHPQRLRRLFAYGANSDPSGLTSDIDKSAIFNEFIERGRTEYRALSATPDDYSGFLKQIQAMWAQQPNWTREQLRHITVRTAIADGAHDEAIQRAHTEYLARTIPHAKLVILDDASHFGMLQNPPEFAGAVLTFLQEP